MSCLGGFEDILYIYRFEIMILLRVKANMKKGSTFDPFPSESKE